MFVVVTTFYTLDGMKSILLPKFVFFRSRLRLSLKNTNSLFYCFIFILRGCCTSHYNIPTSLYTREALKCLSSHLWDKPPPYGHRWNLCVTIWRVCAVHLTFCRGRRPRRPVWSAMKYYFIMALFLRCSKTRIIFNYRLSVTGRRGSEASTR